MVECEAVTHILPQRGQQDNDQRGAGPADPSGRAGQNYRAVGPGAALCPLAVDDLEQEAFIALLDALERWREADGPLLSVYALRLKAAFTAATGRRTQRDRLDPLDRALSLDAPLNDDPDADTLEAVVEDPAGAAAIEEAEAHSDHQQLHGILDHALGALPAEQREVVRRRYYRGQTVAEIATATGVPEKEVRKLEAAALRVLRHPRVSQVLREYR